MTIEVILLGAAQDAGVPQAGCRCGTCLQARRDPAGRKFAACLGLIDRQAQAAWMIDATPDLREQLGLLQEHAPECTLQGILMTHAHMGHIAGLLHLGREAMNTRRLPLYASRSFLTFLTNNAPWKQLVEIGNLEPHEVQTGRKLALSANLTITPVEVPHRGEYSDTLAYQILGEERSLFYCPDIDAWQRGSFDLHKVLAESGGQARNMALLDGTFYSGDELPGRKMSEVPHPLVKESLQTFQGDPTEIFFIHLNHTNPLWQPGLERRQVELAGFRVGEQGTIYVL